MEGLWNNWKLFVYVKIDIALIMLANIIIVE